MCRAGNPPRQAEPFVGRHRMPPVNSWFEGPWRSTGAAPHTAAPPKFRHVTSRRDTTRHNTTRQDRTRYDTMLCYEVVLRCITLHCITSRHMESHLMLCEHFIHSAGVAILALTLT